MWIARLYCEDCEQISSRLVYQIGVFAVSQLNCLALIIPHICTHICTHSDTKGLHMPLFLAVMLVLGLGLDSVGQMLSCYTAVSITYTTALQV